MSKILMPVLLIALSTLLLVANAQTTTTDTITTSTTTTTRRPVGPAERDRQLCERLNERCQATAATLGDRDDAVDAYNQQCRIIRGPKWRNVTRCQIWRAHCELTILRCRRFSCKHVQELLFPRPN